MKIGFNVKKIINAFEETKNYFSTKVVQNENNIANHETRITTLENNSSSEWVEITSNNKKDAIISQPFNEIRLLVKASNANYTVTVPYDNKIFFNSSGHAPTYIIVGNPIENNYGVKFCYRVMENKQFIYPLDVFSGASYDEFEFRAWIR